MNYAQVSRGLNGQFRTLARDWDGGVPTPHPWTSVWFPLNRPSNRGVEAIWILHPPRLLLKGTYTMSFDPTLDQVHAELLEAQSKFTPFNNYHEGYAVILEELDELWDEIKNSKHGSNCTAIRKEAIHLAAMVIRFLQDCT